MIDKANGHQLEPKPAKPKRKRREPDHTQPSDMQVMQDKHDRNVTHCYAMPGKRVIVHSTLDPSWTKAVQVPAMQPEEPKTGEREP